MENSNDPIKPTTQSDSSSDTSTTAPTDTPSSTPDNDTSASSPAVPGASVTPTTATTAPPPSLTMNDSLGNEPTQLPPADSAPIHKQAPLKLALYIVVGLLLLGGASYGSYLAGKHATHPAPAMATSNPVKVLPAGATMIEQCEPGLGTQYVLPKDIPDGPVYNVYKGKLIGIEYMTDLATLQKLNTVLENLPLYSQTYDHLNIMSMPAHAGFPTPHYQVDVMMVPASTTKQITCGGASSTMSGSSDSTMNGNMSNNSTSSASKPSGM